MARLVRVRNLAVLAIQLFPLPDGEGEEQAEEHYPCVGAFSRVCENNVHHPASGPRLKEPVGERVLVQEAVDPESGCCDEEQDTDRWKGHYRIVTGMRDRSKAGKE
jgi:hypothetical protein